MLKKPLLVVPAISSDDRIKFILPNQEVVLEREVTSDAWEILGLCNGINTVDMITDTLTNIDKEFIVGFLNDLNSLRVIADSRKLYEHFHAASCNPMVYTSDITDEEVAAHSNSPRMSVRSGQAFEFQRTTESNLVRLQELRTSCRSFSSEKVSVDDIGSLLDVGYSLSRHAVASAGGLYPMKLFVIVLEDQVGFPAGYYEYDNELNQLVLFNDKPDAQRIFYAFNEVEMPFNAPVLLVIAADSNRQPYKYSNRGYRFMAIEAGQIAQNMTLGAVELGLATCELGSMLDDVVAGELEMNDCLPFLALAVGKHSSDVNTTNSQLLTRIEGEIVGDDKPVQSTWLIDGALSSNFDKSYFQFLALTDNGQIASGISTSWGDAKLKAIAEGYERQRAASTRYDVRTTASNLPAVWLDPRTVAPLSDEQYDKLPHLLKFDENSEIEWVVGRDSKNQEVFVPIDLVFYPIRNMDRNLVVDTCSSGFAAYTNFDEAVNRGILELVERDSLMRNWYERNSPRKLDHSVLPTHLQHRARYWQQLGREVFFLDLSQRGVTTIEVVITSDDYPCFVSGASSSLGRFEEAAIKAFQEAESRLIYGLNETEAKTLEPADVHSVLDHELLYAQSKKFHEYVQFLFDGETSNIAPTATASLSRLKTDLEIVTVDVSEQCSVLKVVKVLSTELIPISFGHNTGHYTHHTLPDVDASLATIPHYFA